MGRGSLWLDPAILLPVPWESDETCQVLVHPSGWFAVVQVVGDGSYREQMDAWEHAVGLGGGPESWLGYATGGCLKGHGTAGIGVGLWRSRQVHGRGGRGGGKAGGGVLGNWPLGLARRHLGSYKHGVEG